MEYSQAAKTDLWGEPCIVMYNVFMIDYKRVMHPFSENAGWHPDICEDFEILASLTHPPVDKIWRKSAYVAFPGPYISEPE